MKEENIKKTPSRTKQPRRGNKVPITFTIDADLLRKVDILAKSKGISRAAFFSMIASYAVDHGIFK